MVRRQSWLTLIAGLVLGACAVQEQGKAIGSAGTFANAGGAISADGGSGTGSTPTSGGASSGGTSMNGGTSGNTGGSAGSADSGGGSSSGGSSSGGSATGGTSSGGIASGGTSTGGNSSGGTGGTASAQCSGVAAWHAGTYAAGDVVQETCSGANASPCPSGETHRFQCKPWPYTGWCGQREPGVGQAWSDAWDDLGRCTGGGGTGGSGTGGSQNTGGSHSTGGSGTGGTATGGTSSGGTNSGGTSSGGTGGSGNASLCGVLTSALFDQVFPANNRIAVYTYSGLLQAAAAYPTFASSSDATTCKRELAAFFANVAWETGGLHYAEQIAKAAYCSSQGGCACDPSDAAHWYYGRGALQLSWNYNYCAAGSALGVDLHADPGRVATDTKLVWQTGLWFWMTNDGAGSQTCHAAITGGGGFGETIRTINGGQECNQGGYSANAAVKGRIDYYVQYCSLLGVDPGGSVTSLGC